MVARLHPKAIRSYLAKKMLRTYWKAACCPYKLLVPNQEAMKPQKVRWQKL
jgi:hypothetical protein